jgi:serine protease AprX
VFGKKDYSYTLKAGETIAVSMIINPFYYVPDLDLYLVDAKGNTVSLSTAAMKRQETISYKALTDGVYTLSVHAYLGTGSYFFDTSVG